MDRRTFLKGAVAGAGVVAAGGRLARAGLAMPMPRTPVQHLVVVMMENRSADHFQGWYHQENEEFDALQQTAFPDLRTGLPRGEAPMVATAPWGRAGRGNFHGRGFEDPSHGWDGGRAERNGGACDGWLDPATGNDEFCLAYYDAADVPVWSQLMRQYQVYDRWFCSLLGPTQPNRYYLHSAQSGGLKNNALPPEKASENPDWFHGWDWDTIWTIADETGLQANYFFCNLPQIAFWGERHLNRARHISEFYALAAAGALPQLSIIDPWYIGPNGVANDDHPHADIRLGQAFLSDVVEAFTSSPCYQRGAMVLTYDEWGGFFDHVPPPRVADDRASTNPADDFGQIGFRIPSTIISPWTRTRTDRKSKVHHEVFEHSSIIKFVSDNWGLRYLNTRHEFTNSIESAFRRFRTYDPSVAFECYDADPALTVEPLLTDPVGTFEPIIDLLPGDNPLPSALTEGSDLHRLAELGWFDNLPVRIDWRFEDSYLRSRPALIADALAGLS